MNRLCGVAWLEEIRGQYIYYIDGLVQERRNFNANALELHLPCTNPSIWDWPNADCDYSPIIAASWPGRPFAMPNQMTNKEHLMERK